MRIVPALFAIAALAACNRPDPVADDANNVEALPTVNQRAPNPTGAPPANAAGSHGSVPAPGGTIPAALLGRWGLTPGDCTSARGDAKGLLIVEPDRIRFYESRAVPSPGIQVSADSVSGNFAFTGEGQEWTKYETLERQGDKLVRTERDPIATFTYVRCG
jgi:hypothetical protein